MRQRGPRALSTRSRLGSESASSDVERVVAVLAHVPDLRAVAA